MRARTAARAKNRTQDTTDMHSKSSYVKDTHSITLVQRTTSRRSHRLYGTTVSSLLFVCVGTVSKLLEASLSFLLLRTNAARLLDAIHCLQHRLGRRPHFCFTHVRAARTCTCKLFVLRTRPYDQLSLSLQQSSCHFDLSCNPQSSPASEGLAACRTATTVADNVVRTTISSGKPRCCP